MADNDNLLYLFDELTTITHLSKKKTKTGTTTSTRNIKGHIMNKINITDVLHKKHVKEFDFYRLSNKATGNNIFMKAINAKFGCPIISVAYDKSKNVKYYMSKNTMIKFKMAQYCMKETEYPNDILTDCLF